MTKFVRTKNVIIVKDLKNLLKEKREAKGFLVKDVAKHLGVDTTLVSKFENGSRKPTKQQIVALAALFGEPEKKWMIQWMSEKILYEIADEDYALDALLLAEEAVKYGAKTFKPTVPSTLKKLLSTADELKKQLNKFRKLNSYKIAEALELEYTYESNRIEGNTLTLKETDLVINEGLTISGKSMREHLEAVNHREAIVFIKELAAKSTFINQHTLLSIHNLILRSIENNYAGKYRDVQVMIKGSKHTPPAPWMVQQQMDEFFMWYQAHKNKMHPIVLAAELHERLVTIHPFVDGNGRTARLLMNLILLQHGFVIANIKGDSKSRLQYYTCLEKAQTEADKTDFLCFIATTEIACLQRYIDIVSK